MKGAPVIWAATIIDRKHASGWLFHSSQLVLVGQRPALNDQEYLELCRASEPGVTFRIRPLHGLATRLTEKEVEHVKQLRAQGRTYSEMQKITGRHTWTLWSALHKQGKRL